MSEPILTDLSAPSLARAIKDNLYNYFRTLGQSQKTEMGEGPSWLRWCTPISHPWFNGVLCNRPPIEGDTAFVEETLAFFHSRGTAALTWWFDPNQSPAEWAPYLEPHGFRFDNSTPGMALALDALPAQDRLPDGLTIITLEDTGALEAWVEVFVEGYPIPRDLCSMEHFYWEG